MNDTEVTDLDRLTAARARQLLEITGTDALCEYTGETDSALAYAAAYGEARYLLAELAAIVTRLDGQAAAQATEDSHG